MKLLTLALTALALAVLAGCAPPSSVSRADYSHSLKNVEVGMSRKDFLTIFPEAEPRGAKMYPPGTMDVLEVNVEQYSFFPTGKATYRNGFTGIERQPRWFYFLNGSLVQYGEPGDWPEADLIVKIK